MRSNLSKLARGGAAVAIVLALMVLAMLAVSLASCGEGAKKQLVGSSPGAAPGSDPDNDQVANAGDRKVAVGPDMGGDDEPEGGEGLLDSPNPADPAYDDLTAVIRPFTDPRTGQTYDIVDGRVIVAFKNPPVLPLMDENYFDVERFQTDPCYSIQYPLIVGDPEIDTFIIAENLTVYSEWRAHRSMAAILPEGTSVEEAVANWPATYPALVLSADPDSVYATCAWPYSGDSNDELFVNQWNIKERTPTQFDINIQTTWQHGKIGNSDVVVAVLDTGIQRSHQDLASRLTAYGANVFPKFGKTKILLDGGEPWPSIVDDNMWNAINVGHGTCVAGILGAVINNDLGPQEHERDVAGITQNVPMLPVAMSGHNEGGKFRYFESTNINAFYVLGAFKGEFDKWQLYPDDPKLHLNIEVVNCSFGGLASSLTYRNVVANVARYSVLVGSAGNDSSDIAVQFPATHSDALAVAAYNYLGQKPTWSNWNPAFVDVAAPGDLITTTDMKGFSSHGWRLGYTDGPIYSSFSGTSASAPHVSAVAALLACYTSDAPSGIRTQIRNNEQPLNHYPYFSLYGGVDAARVFGY
ncbi:MAG: S8 family serine peptidase [bacterium]